MDKECGGTVIVKQSRWDRIRVRTAEATVALFLASIMIQIVTFVLEERQKSVPASEWLTINEIFVPDHMIGTNPPVIYDREVFEQFRGFKLVEVQLLDINGLMFTECSEVEVNEYFPADIIPGKTVSWEWLVGHPCQVGPGVYRLRVSYELRREGWPEKRIVVLSNVFTIREPTSAG